MAIFNFGYLVWGIFVAYWGLTALYFVWAGAVNKKERGV